MTAGGPLAMGAPSQQTVAVARVSTSAGTIGFDARGGGDATPIVFLHGVGSDKSVWRPQLDHFGRSRRAVAFDHPGYGESDFRPGASRDDFAASVLAALDAMDRDRAHVCGLSLGGVVAIAMHALAPERCASLILADSFAVHPDGPAIYERSIAASEDMAAMAHARTPAVLGSSASPEVHAEVRETMARIDPAAFRVGAEAVWLADQRERVDAIGVPTLILVGDEDRVTPPELSRELHYAIPGSRLEVIAGGGHIANLDSPAEFNRLVEQFISEVERG